MNPNESSGLATAGAKFVELSAIVTQACGCVVDYGAIARAQGPVSLPVRILREIIPPKPRYLKYCNGHPLHVSLEDRARIARGG